MDSRSNSTSYKRPMGGSGAYEDNKEPPPTQPNKVLGVFGLASLTTEDTLQNIYNKFDEVEKTIIIKDRETGQSKGFAFVYMATLDGAINAYTATNGMVRVQNM